MNALIEYSINENNFVLSPDRTILWEKQNTLIIADLHICKSGHARKPGAVVSPKVYKEDIQRLFTQILFFKAEQLIIIGGLSHYSANKEMEFFKKWRNDLCGLTIQLVNDNPGILEEKWYAEMNITRSDQLLMEPFSFCHHPEDIKTDLSMKNPYTFCGHLHPGIPMKGKGKKELLFPCFYFKNTFALLPAFNRYSVLSKVNPEKSENVFAIIENSLLQVQ